MTKEYLEQKTKEIKEALDAGDLSKAKEICDLLIMQKELDDMMEKYDPSPMINYIKSRE